MIGMSRFLGLFAIIPTSVLLTISFFVLVVLRKIEGQGLKTFGYVIVVLLWIAAAMVFSAGIYVSSTCNKTMMPMMQRMIGSGTMPGMRHKMMQGNIDESMREKMQQRMRYQESPPSQNK